MALRLYLLFCICISHFAYSQKIWVCAHNIGIDFNSGGPVNILPPPPLEGFGGSAANVCDANGQLLFYTHGSQIWDKNYQPMTPFGLFGSVCGDATSHTAQGTVIVPMPDSSHKYYVFSLQGYDIPCQGPYQRKQALFYSVVDMTLNNGLGGLVPGQTAVFLDSCLTEKMAPVLGDNCNVWLMVHNRKNTDWKAFSIDGAGINPTPVISTCGNFSHYIAQSNGNFGYDTMNTPYMAGMLKFSPDRRKMAAACLNWSAAGQPNSQGLELYDFDPATGVVSNALVLDTIGDIYPTGYFSSCFSPDGSKLYATPATSVAVFQWDLGLPSASAIIQSKTWVGQTNYFGAPEVSDLKLAPDGKIYIPRVNTPEWDPWTARYLHTIDNPNLLGMACQFTFNAFQVLPVQWPYNPVTYGSFFEGTLPNEVVYFVRDTVKDHTLHDTVLCFRSNYKLPVDTAGWDYQWADGYIGADRVVDTSGEFIVSFHTPPCTYHKDTFRVVFNNDLPALAITGIGCDEFGKIVTIVPAPGDTLKYDYTWHDSTNAIVHSSAGVSSDTLKNQASGPYYVHFVNSLGCDTSLSFFLPPGITSGLHNDSAICQGDEVRFYNTATGNINYTWWDFGDSSFSVDPQPVHQYDVPGAYTIQFVVGDTTIPCFDTVYSMVAVDSTPHLEILAENDSLCEGKAMFFNAEYTSGADSLVWAFGDSAWVNLPLQSVFMHAFDTSGTMVVTAIGKYPNCPDVAFSDTVTVLPYPRVDLGPDTFMCPNSEAIVLGDYINQALPAASWFWNTGDTTAYIQVRHPGIYTTRVTVEGCTSNDSIEVFKDCYIDIPNAFTPDGDGINDYFLPRQLLSRGLTGYRMQVFNRWGQLIFESEKLDGRGWDGRFNSTPQPQGVYIYLIEARLKNGAAEKYRGNVTLIR